MKWTITWHKASEELPPKSGKYLVAQISEYNDEVIGFADMYYSARHKAFNTTDSDPIEQVKNYAISSSNLYWAKHPKKIEKVNEVTE